jgi:hypothetical protein
MFRQGTVHGNGVVVPPMKEVPVPEFCDVLDFLTDFAK